MANQKMSDQDKANLKASSNLVEVISKYGVGLRQNSIDWVGLCPFHEEQNPSFNVDPGKGVYYCFGCGAGGDVFTFVQEIEKIPFLAAFARLADRAVSPNDKEGHLIPPELRGMTERSHPETGGRTVMGLRIWRAASPATRTLVESYLQSRGIQLAAR